MPRAPRWAQVTIITAAVLVLVYALSIARFSETTAGNRTVIPGQLLIVRMNGAWTSMSSSDASVITPISISLAPMTAGYFLAARPGHARLTAVDDPCPTTMQPPRCLAAARFWHVDVTVWPSG